ncbi:MAG: WcbI family polysaccharide biosynthesis putative acetyltransferase [Thermodesulfobacteriota bacterium]
MTLQYLEDLSVLPPESRLCLYGAGSKGVRFYDLLRSLRQDVQVLAFVDTYKEGEWEGVPILRPEDLPRMRDRMDGIVITSLFVDEIRQEIEAREMNCPMFYYNSTAALSRNSLDPCKDGDLCLIHANCQGEALLGMLCESPSFAAAYRVLNFYNFSTQDPSPDLLGRCTLFLYQDTPRSRTCLPSLKAGTRAVCIPKISWRVFWPFNSNTLRRYPYGDHYVLDMIQKGYSRDEILRAYRSLDVHALVDLDHLLKANLRYLSSAHNSKDVNVAGFVRERFRSSRLFSALNHPLKSILLLAANRVLELTGHDMLTEKDISPVEELGDGFEMPIHPSIVRHFGLEFADARTTCRQFGEEVDFDSYLENYIDSELAEKTVFNDFHVQRHSPMPRSAQGQG